RCPRPAGPHVPAPRRGRGGGRARAHGRGQRGGHGHGVPAGDPVVGDAPARPHVGPTRRVVDPPVGGRVRVVGRPAAGDGSGLAAVPRPHRVRRGDHPVGVGDGGAARRGDVGALRFHRPGRGGRAHQRAGVRAGHRRGGRGRRRGTSRPRDAGPGTVAGDGGRRTCPHVRR